MPNRHLAFVTLALAAAIVSRRLQADDFYTGLNANWSDPTVWSNNLAPVPADNVFVNPIVSAGAANTLTLDVPASVASFNLGASGGGAAIVNLGGNSLAASTATVLSTGQIIGLGSLTAALDNAGSINASGNLTLTLASTTPSTNTGTISASSGGALQLAPTSLGEGSGAMLNNTGGIISALGDPTAPSVSAAVTIDNLEIDGGQLTTNATGQILLTTDTVLVNASLSGNIVLKNSVVLVDSTVSTTLSQAANVSLGLQGTIVNNGLINCYTYVGAPLALNGTGTLSTNYGLYFSAGSAITLTIGPSQTIDGNRGFQLPGACTNAGAIVADVPISPFVLSAGSLNHTLTNSGFLGAINGAILTAANLQINNADGTITANNSPSAANPSIVSFANVSITGGQLSTDAFGQLQLSNLTLSNLTASGNIATSGTVSFSNLTLSDGQLSSTANSQIVFLNNNTLSNLTFGGNLSANGILTLADAVTGNATLISSSVLALSSNTTFVSSGVTKAQSLNLPNTAAYSLTFGALIITDPTTLPAIQAAIAQGATKTTGLFTTTPNETLAVINNASVPHPFTTFAGQPVAPSSLLIAPELIGDANIDGHVDLNDLNLVLNNLGATNTNWTAGNFDGATTIDLNDLNDVLNNLGRSYVNASFSIQNSTSSVSPVPEPASFGILALASTAFFIRRRKV